MRIKKFDAETLQGALAKVKKDFGPEAVILHTKKYKKGGIFGLFGSERTEVTAGIDINIEKPRTPQFAPAAQQPVPSYGRTQQVSQQYIPQTMHRQAAPPQQQTSQVNMDMIANYRRVEDISLKNEAFARELNEGKISLGGNIRGMKEPSGAGVNLKDGIGRIQKLLLDNGVEENLVFRTLQTINSQLSDAQINNKQYIDNYLLDYLSGMIKVSGPFKTAVGTPKIISFIGPTGVGKTTTLAKLAAKYALVENKKVVLVSADTYRIAAEAQLKKYGEIMGIPVEIVLTPADFKKVINKHMDKDIIFFDTAGRSPRNKKQLMELKEFMEVYSPMETHLVVSAVTKYYDALSIINNFGMVPIHRILFTKLDETKNYGMLLNLSVGSGGIPVSYLTVGQTVPDDIEVADSGVMARLILKGDFEAWIKQRNSEN
ncbi:MAG: flagellar biosynthesis protein FlhF [Candidatus Goldiibacteriota bacterium HGW-Goldbacteria-1]|jgi:flagellar biosynthesis protein FlhF|nr:MAG: flagellar biosynthesis protein FlhF [Candidatus Goldiibacteriota bacterium HGW-Goldbacteria-1]